MDLLVVARRVLPLLALLVPACGGSDRSPASPSRGPAPVESAPASARIVVVRGANVLPMTSEAVLRDHAVVIRDGVIASVVPDADVTVPTGARVVEASGGYLVPGLVDTHVHLDPTAPYQLDLYLAHGVTTVQNMSGSPEHLALRAAVARGEVEGPRILTTGPTTARVGLAGPADARRLVRDQKAAGYDAIKQYGAGAQGPMSMETYRALAAAAKQADIRLVGHAPRELPFAEVLAAGQDSIDHAEELVYTYEGFRDPLAPVLNAQWRGDLTYAGDPAAMPQPLPGALPAIDALARAAADRGLALAPGLVTFATITAHTEPDAIESLGAQPGLEYIDPVSRLQWAPARNRYIRGWRERRPVMRAALTRSLAVQRAITAAFHSHGVPLMTGSDAPLPFVIPGLSVHDELAELVGVGLSPYEALRAATIVPARELRLPDQGTVEVGKRADLLLVRANPLVSIANTRDIAGVAARGRWLDRAQLDDRLRAIEARHARVRAELAPVLDALTSGSANALIEAYRKATNPNATVTGLVESELNRAGYAALGAGEHDKAVAIFRANAEFFPDSWNVWDSLGEAQAARGDRAAAVASYERSVALNPDNENGKKRLKALRPDADSH